MYIPPGISLAVLLLDNTDMWQHFCIIPVYWPFHLFIFWMGWVGGVDDRSYPNVCGLLELLMFTKPQNKY